MRGTKGFRLLATAFFTVASMTLAWGAAPAGQPQQGLSNVDCAKCHAKPAADIEAKGGAHKTEVGCQDCHVGHPPAKTKKEIIPACSQCHTGKPHYKLPNCLGCHRNPHQPKVITFGKDVTDACISCHTPQIAKLKANPSKHTKLNCSFCHEVHGKIPLCTQCHKPHSADMGPGDCKKCHQAHMPTVVTYGADTPNKSCAACHATPHNELAATKTKHNKVTCVKCHQNKHKTVPNCQDCHGTPHPAGMMAKFNTCGTCHNTAHNLNNWTATEKPDKAAKPAPKGKKK